jgi:toxin ParE1/3/4
MAYEITEPAEQDIKGILRETLKGFGTWQLGVYEQIIEKGMAMVGEDPEWPGSIDRSEVAPGVRLLHLELAAGRRGAAAHCLYYTTGSMSNGVIGTLILRVLHEGMEPRYKVVRSLWASGRTAPQGPPTATDVATEESNISITPRR